MRLTIASVKKVAAKYGATVDAKENEGYMTVNIDAAHGKVWRGDGCHCLCGEFRIDDGRSAQEIYEDLIERMEHGMADCDDPECDMCHPVEE